jgi:hypothetical protein
VRVEAARPARANHPLPRSSRRLVPDHHGAAVVDAPRSDRHRDV